MHKQRQILHALSLQLALSFILFATGHHRLGAQPQGSDLMTKEAINSISLQAGATFRVVQTDDSSWGIKLDAPGNSATHTLPASIALYSHDGQTTTLTAPYSSVQQSSSTIACQSTVEAGNDTRFQIEDIWSTTGTGILQLDRKVRVHTDSLTTTGGFVSALLFDCNREGGLSAARHFVPGAMYGAPEHMLPTAAGGAASFESGAYEIREDQMAAPLLGAYFRDGTSLALLNPAPRGGSTAADFKQPAQQQIDDRFHFGAFGASETSSGSLNLAFWYPGTRGFLSPAVPADPHAFRRYHPVTDGFEHQYSLLIRIGDRETFHSFYSGAWRWAWDALKPVVNWHDLAEIRRLETDMLASQLIVGNGATGWPNSVNLATDPHLVDRKAVMGFTGKCIEAAVLMLMEAERDPSRRKDALRQKALAVINQFLKLEVAPPEGEGFQLDTGALALALPKDEVVYLRSFSDDMKLLLYGYAFEQKHGRDHPEWLGWCQRFADWLLTQQSPAGGFPRSWKPATGAIANSAPQSSYNPVPMLVLLSQLTGENKYREAAIRAAEFCWTTEHADDNFVGGTIDNPNILDKEAATLSLEAYLALFEDTGHANWLYRARRAADFAETFTFLWNVPMPVDASDADLHWKHGVPTTGMNGVNTSLPGCVDNYLAFDVDRFARLYKHTGDRHYFNVARLLLHNTKNSLAISGRTFDLPGPGWQSEHVVLGPPHRGVGFNRLWLPWVSTCQLHGIVFTEQRTPELFEELARNQNPDTAPPGVD